MVNWIGKSITLKILLFVGVAVSALLFVQTYVVSSNIDQLVKPLIDKNLNNALIRSEDLFINAKQQVYEDAQIIRAHNALNNYIDFASLGDEQGTNEELVALELFLTSFVQTKPQYTEIKVFINDQAIIKLQNGRVVASELDVITTAEGYDNQVSSTHFFVEQEGRIFLQQSLQFNRSPDDGLIVISSLTVMLKRDITNLVNNVVEDLRTIAIDVQMYSEKEKVFASRENTDLAFDDYLMVYSTTSEINASLTLGIAKQQAYILINEVNSAGQLLLVTLLLVMAVSLYVTTRKIVGKPLQKLITFVNDEILNNSSLTKRYPVTSNDEIGVFSHGLNRLLDDINHREQALKKSEERLNLALWGSSEGMWEFVFKDRAFYFSNTQASALFGDLDNQRILVEDFDSIIHPEDLEFAKSYIYEFLTECESDFHLEFRYLFDEQYKWIMLRGKVTHDSEGSRYSVLGIVSNINKEKQDQEQIKLYATAFESSASSILIIDSDLKVLTVNKAFTKVTGYELEDIIHKLPHFVHNANYSSFNINEFRMQIEKTGNWFGELTGKRKDGDSFVKEIEIDAIRGLDGEPSHYVCVFTDVTEKRQSQQDLIDMANHDTLTSLPNRGYFRKKLERTILHSRANKSSFAVLFLDLDRFKRVNDTLGHEVGDALLKAVSKLFTESVRKQDVIARLGGDEFAIILKDIGDIAIVKKICDGLIEAFTTSSFFDNKETGVGLSIGISMFPQDASTSDALLHCADTAMYFSKTNGRNRWSFFASSMSDHVNRRNLIESELRIAIAQDTLSLQFQPQISLKTGEVVSFEALSRWDHADLGKIGPDEFISIAEDSGLIVEVGQRALEHACWELKSLHDKGYTDLRMAVNLSPKQFLLSDICADVNYVLKKTQVPPHLLELELTESLIIDDPETIIKMLEELKTLGVRLSIDDFGTGYSSLSYLSKFPLDVLKIDKSFINQIGNDKKSLALTQSIIAIAHILDLEVIAEGVETQQQLTQLKNLNTEIVQGFFFSKPLSSKDIVNFIEKTKGPSSSVKNALAFIQL